VKVLCINSDHKPNDFPASKWIKKGQKYTVVKVLDMVIQGGQGLVLEEIDMTGCEPYKAFGAWRFRPLHETPEEIAVNELEWML
jgi:hypothetical protein